MKLSSDLQNIMESLGIDIALSTHILTRSQKRPPEESFQVIGKDSRIVDHSHDLWLSRDLVEARWKELNLPLRLDACSREKNDMLVFSPDGLHHIGSLLFPRFSQGILNGGSSTSYLDMKKNQDFQPDVFPHLQARFSQIAERYAKLPKALLPSFIRDNGSEGPNFLAMKLKNLDLAYARYCRTMQPTTMAPEPLQHPLFQMTSTFSAAPIARGLAELRESTLISDGMKKVSIPESVQPLVAALTHSEEGLPRRFFTEAYGKAMHPLPLPGGHGQSFQVLASVYAHLYRQGVRYVTLGNIDNLGYTYDPITLARLALSDAVAFFEFSPRSVLDRKGGVLVKDTRDRLTCADMGVSIPASEVDQADSVLFNCATGWFKLDYLIDHLSHIIDHIPLRVSDQQKDAGKYAQGEYVTWEAIALFHPLHIIKVSKSQRFLAAKTLSETLIQSGIQQEIVLSHYPEARILIEGLHTLLSAQYAM